MAAEYRRHGGAEGTIRLRAMRQEDVSEVAALERELFSDPWSEQGFSDSLGLADTVFLVAEQPEASAEEGRVDRWRIVGYLGMYLALDEGEIVNVAAAPWLRRCGVGSLVLEAALAEGARRGVSRFILEVRVSNDAAIRMYEKYGFVRAGLRKGFYEHPREDAWIMVKETD